jgi:hypothetical protein
VSQDDRFICAQDDLKRWHSRHSTHTPDCPHCEVERLQACIDRVTASLAIHHEYWTLRESIHLALDDLRGDHA